MWTSCGTRNKPRWSTTRSGTRLRQGYGVAGGFRLTDQSYTLPPVRISRREAFSFGLARKLLTQYEATPLHLDMRCVLAKIAESLEGDVTLEPDPPSPAATAWQAGTPPRSSGNDGMDGWKCVCGLRGAKS